MILLNWVRARSILGLLLGMLVDSLVRARNWKRKRYEDGFSEHGRRSATGGSMQAINPVILRS